MFLLHTHGEAGGEGIVGFLEEVVLHGLLETLKIIPFLFLTYLLMEFIEHKASEKAESFMKRAGVFGPCVGGLLGAVPQCGFSAAAANLYTGRVITVGTLIAVFLSTSDEMIPILVGGTVPFIKVLLIVLYKAVVAIIVGFAVDLVLRLAHKGKQEINIDELCERDECHCEKGILYSALHHTITITVFVLIVTFAINTLVYFVGEETLGSVMHGKPVLSHLIAALVGLVPNCASSVLLARLYSEGIITVGTMLAGLFSGAGVGVLVLFKVNRHTKDNLLILALLIFIGAAFGLLGEIIFA